MGGIILKLSNKNIIFIAIIINVVAAWFSIGWHHPDEHFQIIEFTYAINEIKDATHLPMEYATKMRPTPQVWFTHIAIKILNGFSVNNPFLIAFILRLFAAVFCIFASVKFHNSLQFNNKISEKTHLLLLLLGWALVYVHVRFSSETIGAATFIYALSLYNKSKKPIVLIAAAFLAIIGFYLRFQTAFFILGFAVYFIYKNKKFNYNYLYLLFGAILALLLCTLADTVFYKTFTLTPYNYFYYNIVKKVAAGFGTQPWYWYIQQTVEKLIPPYSLFAIIATFFLVLKRKTLLIGLICLFFITGHMLVEHKELRFIFPLLFFTPYAVIYFWETLNAINNKILNRLLPYFANSFAYVNILLVCIVMFKPAHELPMLYKFLFNYNVPVKIYYTNNNPYYSGNSAATFYINKHVVFLAFNPNIKPEPNALLLTENFTETEKLNGYNLIPVYKTYPLWFSKINFNNWLSRVNCYSIYSLEKIK